MLRLKTEYLLDREVKRVLGALTHENNLAIQVSLHTGLRISDVLELKTEQLNKRFWVTEKKTKKRRMVGLPAPLLQELRGIAGKRYVFENRLDSTKHRTRQAVWKDVKRAAKAFRLKQNVAPHSFRKVYAVDLMAKYGDIERVRKALNHSDSSTTTVYALADALLTSSRLKKEARVGVRY